MREKQVRTGVCEPKEVRLILRPYYPDPQSTIATGRSDGSTGEHSGKRFFFCDTTKATAGSGDSRESNLVFMADRDLKQPGGAPSLRDTEVTQVWRCKIRNF
jgi:hypothetical protein